MQMETDYDFLMKHDPTLQSNVAQIAVLNQNYICRQEKNCSPQKQGNKDT